jgi:RNA polymerase sigma-70 factor (ECF subfamily)
MATGAATSLPGRIALNEQRWRGYLDGIRSGDADSLGSLYDESSSVLFSLAVRILNDAADAEEVVLDVYQQIWRKAETFDVARGTVWGWLTVLTRNRAIDRLRHAGPRRNRESPLDDTTGMASSEPPPEQQSLMREERAMVRKALATLAPEQREAIELAFFRGLTHVEVAEAVGAPLGTIKTRIRMGMRKLRDALGGVEDTNNE